LLKSIDGEKVMQWQVGAAVLGDVLRLPMAVLRSYGCFRYSCCLMTCVGMYYEKYSIIMINLIIIILDRRLLQRHHQ